MQTAKWSETFRNLLFIRYMNIYAYLYTMKSCVLVTSSTYSLGLLAYFQLQLKR